jgi:hypothetical protein
LHAFLVSLLRAPWHPSRLNYLNIRWSVRFMKLLIRNFFLPTCYFLSLSGLNIFWALSSQRLSICFPSLGWETKEDTINSWI